MRGGIVIAVVVSTLGVAAACREADRPLAYEGSSTIGQNIIPAAAEAFHEKTGVAFTEVGSRGSGEGFAAAMAGRVPVGGLSRELKETELAERPYFRIIGYDALAVVVHASNPVADLTLLQVGDVFAGKITNWKAVGGKDAPIKVVTEVKTGQRATIEVFQQLAMRGVPFGPSLEIELPADCVKHVAGDPTAITHAARVFVVPGTKAIRIDGVEPTNLNVQLGSYVLSRPLVLVTKGAPKGSVKKFFDFMLSPEGQEIVTARNFVAVR